ncbi:MAG: hypothetical protein CMH54_00080 [Myxococcales bacterium]|nr:hypothetical protein [Myxococcales bacterium]
MKRLSRYMIPFAASMLLFACADLGQEEQVRAQNTPQEPASPEPTTTPVASPNVEQPIGDPGYFPTVESYPAVQEEIGTSGLTPVPEPAEDPYRSRKRMDIDQLDASMQVVAGGIIWSEDGDDESDFQELAATLGVPDYAIVTQEIKDPSALFQKFLSDAARSVCSEIVESELSGLLMNPILFVHVDATDTLDTAPEQVNANLQDMLLRFHGRHVEIDSPALAQWRWLFHTVSQLEQDPALGWRAVCVALFTHPEFFTY